MKQKQIIEDGIFISRDIIIDEDPDVKMYQYSLWKDYMRSKKEDAGFWLANHMEKDHPITLSDHFMLLKETGFVKIACQWRLYNFAITTAVRETVSKN